MADQPVPTTTPTPPPQPNQTSPQTNPPTPNSSTKLRPLITVILVFIVLIVLAAIAVIAFSKFNQPPYNTDTTPAPESAANSPTDSAPDGFASSLDTEFQPPEDWIAYSQTDPDFKVQINLSLPLGFAFEFTGSDFTIRNSDSSEIWNVVTSVTRLEDESLTNTYSGGDVNAWYRRYFNQLHGASNSTIQSVSPTGLFYTATVDLGGGVTETRYLVEDSGYMVVIRPSSQAASSDTASLLPQIAILTDTITIAQTN